MCVYWFQYRICTLDGSVLYGDPGQLHVVLKDRQELEGWGATWEYMSLVTCNH